MRTIFKTKEVMTPGSEQQIYEYIRGLPDRIKRWVVQDLFGQVSLIRAFPYLLS
jgi:hypothetical protein